MKYRKKPIEIEAEQWDGLMGKSPKPVCFFTNFGDCIQDPHIHTLEGPLRIQRGDWVITGVQGEHYPCKPDIFEATYEPVV